MLRLARAVLMMVGVMAAASGLAMAAGHIGLTSDDGLRIVYSFFDPSVSSQNNSIVITNPYTLTTERLTIGEEPSCSTQFNLVAFAFDEAAFRRLQVIDVFRHNVIELLQTPASPGDIVWSPDSRELAYTLYGGQRLDNEERDNEIAVIDLDDLSEIRVTDNHLHELDPIWALDGQSIVFSSINENQQSILMIFDRSNSTTTQLTQPYWSVDSPNWSPDGNHILGISHEGGSRNLVSISRDGQEIRKLVENGAGSSWSPDRRHLAVSLRSYLGDPISILDIQTGQLTKIPGTEGGFNQVWSPDGRHMAFVVREKDNSNLYLINPDGSDLRHIRNARYLDSPCWLYVQDFPEGN